MKHIKTLALLLCFSLIFMLCGCGKTSGTENTSTAAPSDVTVAKVAVLKGPTGMGLSQFIEAADPGFEFTIETAADVVTSALVSGEVDIAAIPSNAAAALYAKTQGKIKIIAVNTLNVLGIYTSDESVKDISDLDGRTVYSAGEGTTVEYFIQKIFTEYGISPNLEFTSEHTETLTLANTGKADIIVLPEPFASKLLSANTAFRAAFDLNEKITEKNIPVAMGVYAVRADFAAAHPGVIENFKMLAKKSHEALLSDTKTVAAYIEKQDIMTAAIAEKAVLNCDIRYVDGDEMKTLLGGVFGMLYEVNPQSIGGTLPDDGIYF